LPYLLHHRANLKEGANAFDGAGARLSPSAKVEHEARIAHRLAPESGGRRVAAFEIVLNVPKKMHG
jgi:hypothetical protein